MDLQTGVLYREDNLTQLAQFPDDCVDLVYLDPPFFSNRVYVTTLTENLPDLLTEIFQS